MKILLLGEYSNVHATLARGLRALGHTVCVASDGDGWKDYPRDLDLRRRSLGAVDTLRYLWRLRRVWPRLEGFDVVQLINPVFLDLRAERLWPYYEALRRRNGKVVLGAFGIDAYWVSEGLKADTLRYSDFYLDGRLRHNAENDCMERDWLVGPKGTLGRAVAADADAIVSGLYEYDVCYRRAEAGRLAGKTTFIPFPIDLSQVSPRRPHPDYEGLRFFIGIQRTRSAYKGTDILLQALEALQRRYPMQIVKAESVPFATYQRMMDTSDVLVDQLYSYTPAMNALLAMAKGLVVVGGGEEEQYALLGERTLRPIVNVRPHLDDVMAAIEERLLTRPIDEVRQLQADSRTYIERYHDHLRVAQQYEKLYRSL